MFLKCTTKEIPKRGKTVQNIQSKHIHKYIYGKGSQAKGLHSYSWFLTSWLTLPGGGVCVKGRGMWVGASEVLPHRSARGQKVDRRT